MEKILYDLFGFYESDRFIRVDEYRHWMCVHQEPQRTSFINHEFIPSRTVMNKYAVDLREFMNSNGTIGYAGQCKVCGKVYYR